MEKVQLHNAKGWPEQVALVSGRECPEHGGMQRWADFKSYLALVFSQLGN